LSGKIKNDISRPDPVISSSPGSLLIPSPLAFAEGLFILKYFTKKEGFLISNIVYIY